MCNNVAMDPKCIICGTSSYFLLKKDGFSVYECPNCLLSFVYPQPSQRFLAEEVYSEKSGYQANKVRDLSQAKPTRKQKKLLKYLRTEKRGSFLDVGCSSGELMFFVRKLGYEVEGVELNPRTAKIAEENGLKVWRGTLENVEKNPAKYNYVHMGDLIEHVTDPLLLVRQTKELLKTGGEVIIITPNMQCFWAGATKILYKLIHIPWGVITPPHHLFQFRDSNLKQLMQKEGFDFKQAWYTGTPTLKYELGSLHLLKKFKKERSLFSFMNMVCSFGIYTIIFGLNRIVEIFPVKRFSMALVFVKRK